MLNAEPSGTFVLTGLTVGHGYKVQLWFVCASAAGSTASVISGGGTQPKLYGNTGSGLGQYAIGTFIADNTNQTIYATGLPSSSGSIVQVLNAIQVRTWSGTAPPTANVIDLRPIADDAHIKASSTDGANRPYQVSDWSGMPSPFPTVAAADSSGAGRWVATDVPSWIAWDLGATYTIAKLHVWNPNDGSTFAWGIKTFNIQTASSAPAEYGGSGTWADVSDDMGVTLYAYDIHMGTSYTGEGVTLYTPVTTRYIRFNNMQRWGSGWGWMSMSEVLFYGFPGGNKIMVTAGLTGTVSKSYDGNTTATLAPGNYTLSGVLGGDTVTLNNPATGAYDTAAMGTGKVVTVNGLSISGASATNYTLASTSVSGAIGTITASVTPTLAYTAVPGTGTVGLPFSVTVQSQDTFGNPQSVTNNTTITLSKASGSGTLSGTLTGIIASGANSVTISTPVYSAADTMTLTATPTAGMTGLTPVTSGSIVFSATPPAAIDLRPIADDAHIKAPAGDPPHLVSDWSGMVGTFPDATGCSNSNGMWTAHADPTWIAWDLGATYTITKMHVWNSNYPYSWNWGVLAFDIQTASSAPGDFGGGGTWTDVSGDTGIGLVKAEGYPIGSGMNTTGQVVNLVAPVTTRYIRFNNMTRQQSGGWMGLSEVVFYGTPGALASITLTGSAGANGTISPASTNVPSGGSAGFVVTASNYYRIASLTTNGTSVGMSFNNNSTSTNFTWSNAQANGTLAALFTTRVANNSASTPYWWLAKYGLTNAGATFDQAAAADQDHDGLSAWQEYIAGTDPANAASTLKVLSVTSDGISQTVKWLDATGAPNYNLRYSINLTNAGNGWVDASNNIVRNPPTNSVTITPPSQPVFYKITVTN